MAGVQSLAVPVLATHDGFSEDPYSTRTSHQVRELVRGQDLQLPKAVYLDPVEKDMPTSASKNVG